MLDEARDIFYNFHRHLAEIPALITQLEWEDHGALIVAILVVNVASLFLSEFSFCKHCFCFQISCLQCFLVSAFAYVILMEPIILDDQTFVSRAQFCFARRTKNAAAAELATRGTSIARQNIEKRQRCHRRRRR